MAETIKSKQNGKTRAQIITILMQAYGRPVTAREIMNIVYPGNKNESQISDELRYMLQQGKVVRSGTAQQYFYDLLEKKQRNYFCVMQNKAFAEEYVGGYLWAPQQGNNGAAANHSWTRMKNVKAGDVIIHGYKQQVVAISIASIRNGTPNKYGFYFDPNENKYQTVAKFGSTDTEAATDAAYNNVKMAIYELIVAGGKEDYEAIEKNLLSTVLKGKLLCIYFPEKYMNIYSEEHIKFYMDILGIPCDETKKYMTWLKQIIDWKNENPIAKNWTNHEFSKFLYHGIGYPPDNEKHKKAVKKFEKKIDDALVESIDEVTESELPEDDSYIPVPGQEKILFQLLRVIHIRVIRRLR